MLSIGIIRCTNSISIDYNLILLDIKIKSRLNTYKKI